MFLLLQTAFAGKVVDFNWSADPITRYMPDCSGDFECSQALDKMKSSVKSEAKRQVQSSEACSKFESTMGASSSSLQSFNIREVHSVPSGGELTWYVTGKVTCVFYE